MLHHSPSSVSYHYTSSGRSVHSVSGVNNSSNALSPAWIKWVLLFFSSMIMLGLYYLISMPASVRQHLKQQMTSQSLDYFETCFQLAFTLAFVPGIILPFFAGYLVDAIGSRGCLVTLSTICCVGQALASVGVEQGSWALVLLGRLVFGVGFESLFVANEAFLAAVFDHDLGMALGVSSAASFVGYLLSPVLSPIAANRINVAFSFWVGTFFIGISVLASLGVYSMTSPKQTLERKGESSSRNHDLDVEIDVNSEHVASASNQQRSKPRIAISQIRKFSLSFWLLCLSCSMLYGMTTSFVGIASGLLLEQYLFIDPPGVCSLVMPHDCQSGYLAPNGNDAVDLKGFACAEIDDNVSPSLPQSINVTGGSWGASPWNHQSYFFESLSKDDIDCTDSFWSEACTQEYCYKQDSATRTAGLFMATPFIITVLTTFVFGHYGVDQFKCHFVMVALSPLLLAVAHGMFAFRIGSCLGSLILIGFGFSIYVSAVWPSVSFLVPADSLGTAFGIMTCIQAIGNSLYPLVAASIYIQADHRYVPGAELFFVGSSIILVLIGCIVMHRERCRKNNNLDSRESHSEEVAIRPNNDQCVGTIRSQEQSFQV